MSQARSNNSLSKRNNNRAGKQRVATRGPYKKSPQEIRNLAIAYCYTNDNMSVTEAAKKLGVKRSTLSTQLKLYVNEGRNSLEKRGRKSGETVKFTDKHEDLLSILLTWIALRRLIEYINKLLEKGIAYKTNYIFVDEAGFNANLIRSVGYSKEEGQSAVTTQRKRALNVSILAGISYHGVEGVSVKRFKGGFRKYVSA
ncbi:hypothetical protein [Parasitella parasitica]|uniref:Insertion element IS150 protein InsJ-like helix-turn-helix domain-containing protein n=1 Tax=Parasitella parasitica TaxID=35722 RepID=A0A0B7NJU0_9FUNG|nr:hypothetical protein [Parasitella parasitica]